MTRLVTVGCIAVAFLAWPALSLAAERSVTLSVERMICSACAYRVRKALAGVAGVKQAMVSIADKSAVVVYEDTQTDERMLIVATAKAGFPALVRK